MAQIFLKHAQSKAAEPAVIDEFGTTNWGDFNTRVNQLIRALRALGAEKGTHVGIMSGNRREYYEAMTACFHASMVVVPINWHFVSEEVAYLMDDSGAEILIADSRFTQLARDAVQAAAHVRHTIIIDGSPEEGLLDYEALLAEQSKDEPENQGFGGMMFYTSGTTGRPKGVVSGSSDMLGGPVEVYELMGAGMSEGANIPADGTTLLCGPVYHSAQWAYSYLPFIAGSTVVCQHKFEPSETLRLIDANGVTNVHLVPTQFVRLLRYKEDCEAKGVPLNFKGEKLCSIWHGAAPCAPSTKRAMIDWWGPIITEYYGGTEGGIASAISSEEWLEKPGSVGKVLPNMEVMIIDDDGKACDPGVPGTIYMTSGTGADFKYHNRPEETAERHLSPGVFTLGDIGYMSEEGYLYLTDRKIDMIISGGVNIYPAEIEGALTAHPAVQDVAVFGIPNTEFGEEVKAAIELIDGAKADAEMIDSLRAHCEEHLARYKVPRTFDFPASMPRTPTGKLYKRLLREPYWEGHEKRI